MSIFGKIMSTIFGGAAHADAATPVPPGAALGSGAAAAAPGAAAAGAPTPMSTVDVAAVMDKLADASSEDLDWRKSIVDLMKLIGMDSGLAHRKELAHELGYTGNTSDSAAMNIWLHKQVMTKLAANGGVVPKELLH